MRTLWSSLLASVILSSASTAHAQVMTVVVPPNAFVGIKVKVRVEGRNPCGAVEINFGDTTPVATHPITALPFEIDHTWTSTGEFTVVATGQGNCSGSASAHVKVAVFKGISPNPKITGYFGLARPGGVAGIVGNYLGTDGKLTATLKKFSGGTLAVEFKRTDDPDTTNILEWKPGLVGIRWPEDISGVRAQDATLQITYANGKSTNEWTVAFVPAQEFKMLPRGDVDVVSCSLDANKNICNHVEDMNACAGGVSEWAWADPWLVGNSTFQGWHSNCWGAVGDDSGTDIYQITLKNGWVLESFEFDKDVSGDDGDFVKAPSPDFPRGAATWKVSVKWLASSDDEVTYDGFVGISGPKGVPHK
jgi:hypothetical protein